VPASRIHFYNTLSKYLVPGKVRGPEAVNCSPLEAAGQVKTFPCGLEYQTSHTKLTLVNPARLLYITASRQRGPVGSSNNSSDCPASSRVEQAEEQV
jgi:hypothetical protein